MTMQIMEIPHPLTIISPHLDDAVFSCGCLIAAASEVIVVTALAGLPDADAALPPWDRAAGFDSARQAVLRRREEDALSLAVLGATPEWLDGLDGQYGHRQTPESVMTALAHATALHRGGTVVAPMGLFHSDHLLVSRACMMMRATLMSMRADGTDAADKAHAADADQPGSVAQPPLQWLFYEDAIHRRVPGVVQNRLHGWRQEGLAATPVHFPSVPYRAAKMRAVAVYASQLPLFDAEQLADIGAPERYWSVDVA